MAEWMVELRAACWERKGVARKVDTMVDHLVYSKEKRWAALMGIDRADWKVHSKDMGPVE